MAMFRRGCQIVFVSSLLAAEVAGMQANSLSARTNSTLEQAAQLSTGIWVEGSGNSCPTGAIMLNAAECEALAFMDVNPNQFSMLSSAPIAKLPGYLGRPVPFPTSAPALPKGCSVQKAGMFRFFFYNTHASGAAKAKVEPACKNDPWVMAKSACPAGQEGVGEAKCIDFATDKKYVWGGQVSSDGDPPGCFGRGGTGMPTYGTDSFQIGKVFYNTKAGGSLTNAKAFPVCDYVPIVIPSPVANGSDAGPAAKATGDPHMTTISGVKFDIMRTGTHTLFHIPQAALKDDTLLHVQARVRHEGAKCEDMYMKVLNVTGLWAEERRVGGFSFVTESPGPGQLVAPISGAAQWTHLGMVDLKVVRGKTKSGVLYLNIYAKHLHKVSKMFSIGGILGLDDHAEAATPSKNCKLKVLSLAEFSLSPHAPRDRSRMRESHGP